VHGRKGSSHPPRLDDDHLGDDYDLSSSEERRMGDQRDLLYHMGRYKTGNLPEREVGSASEGAGVPKRLITMGHRDPWHGRGLFLLAHGFVMIMLGLSLIPSVSQVPEAAQKSLTYAIEIMHLRGWGIVWIVIGSIVCVGGFFKFDRWFFTLSNLLFTLWATFYLCAWIKFGWESRAWLGFALYMGYGIGVYAVARLHENGGISTR
jgi:hypothetical protein